jgi:hypothetical protein
VSQGGAAHETYEIRVVDNGPAATSADDEKPKEAGIAVPADPMRAIA